MDSETKLTIRLPRSLHAQLTDYANRDERSLNATIIRLLREALQLHKVDVDISPG